MLRLSRVFKSSGCGGGGLLVRWYSSQYRVENNKTSLSLVYKSDSGAQRELRFDPHWLRFNCHSAQSQQLGSGQRTIDVDSIPNNLTINKTSVVDQNVVIDWTELPETTIIPVQFLISNHPSFESKEYESKRTYGKLTKLDFFDYKDILKDQTAWLNHLAEYGLCVVKNLPCEDNQVTKLASLIAPVQRTIYGEKFDVKVDDNPINIAYSNAKLELHMDLMYYESPPGLQFLHCLKFDSSIEGGESIFLDSFQAAEEFRSIHPKHFDTLTRLPATFKKIHFERDWPVFMFYQRPHIVLNHRNKITGVNWSPAFEGPLMNMTQEEIKAYYQSYLRFTRYINNHKEIIKYRLKPGEVACFNNRRVLHGRDEFKTSSQGTRHFQGCYVNIDEFKSQALLLENRKRDPQNTDIQQVPLSNLKYGNHDFY